MIIISSIFDDDANDSNPFRCFQRDTLSQNHFPNSFTQTEFIYTHFLILHISFLSTVSAFIGAGGSREKDPAPNPLINITVHPPSHAILSREYPLYLPCEAIYTGPDTSNEFDSNYDDEEIDERSNVDDGSLDDGDFAKRDKMRDTHFADLKSDVSIVSSDSSDENELHKREIMSATDHRKAFTIFYQWLRNDELIHSNNETKIFPNGTLRLTHSPIAAGTYRCMANFSILSIATHVQQAGKFFAATCKLKSFLFLH